MKRARARITRGAENGVRQISIILSAMGCKLKKVCDKKYQVFVGLEDTGLLLYFGRETTEQSKTTYVLAVMTYPIPENDHRFYRSPDHEETESFPHVKAILGDHKENTLLFEFIARSVHYFMWSKLLRKWRCYNCLAEGYEVFLANGSISTYDSHGNEFNLVIVGPAESIQGTVFDEKIGENVLPVCAACRKHIYYESDNSCNVGVNKLYFERLLERWPQTARVMSANCF